MTQTASSNSPVPDIREMFAAYRRGVDTVAGYMEQAVALLDDFYGEQDGIVVQLKALLARNHSLRHADFHGIFAAVLARRDQARAPLARLVNNYRASREAVLYELRGMFRSNMARVREIWPRLKAKLLEEQQDDTRQAVAALRRIHVEQEELSAALRGLLTRGEKLNFADLKTVANRLAKQDSRHSAELAELLAVCETAARQAGEKWQKLAG